jgi:predicted nuclease of restriction endonuclease-like (RecB) superfamily
MALLDKVEDRDVRRWYARATIEHGWSRRILVHQVESRLHERQGQAATNFDRTLPPAKSDLAKQLLKDPYAFDFLDLGPEAQERDLERALLERVRDFLLELGSGFALVGSQVHLEVGEQGFYLDLLFYHLRLRSFVVVELKTGEFKPEHAGKMNFYLAAVDDLWRQREDGPSIGIILCKSKNRVIVEYALRDTTKPIGVAEYTVTEKLPEGLRGMVPSAAEIRARLSSEDD